MATALSSKTQCASCGKEKATLRCRGCLKEFCHKHLGVHRQELNKQLDEMEVNHDRFRQSLTQQIEESNNHIMMQQIDKWERDSIKKIRKTAEEARQLVLTNTNRYIHQLETKLNNLTDQLKQSRNEDDFNEINLRHLQEELKRLTNEFTKPSNISIRKDSTPLIHKIIVTVSESKIKSNIHHNTIWLQNGFIVAGGNGRGDGLNQFHYPHGIYVDDDQTIYVTDYGNDRIVEWRRGATTGQVVAGGNGKGNKMNQLNCPTDVILDKEKNNLIICDCDNRRVVRWPRRNGASGQIIISNIDCRRLTMDNDGNLYISDWDNNEVRRWKMNDTSGTLVAGGNGEGNRLNQLNWPTGIFVDEDHSVYVSDYNNHRVMKWMKGETEGVVVAGGYGQGNGLTQLSGPVGVIVDHIGTVYVADKENHRIIRWSKGATQGNIVVGDNYKGKQDNQLNTPKGLSFDRQENLYVADCFNHRVQRFNINQS